MAAKAVIDIPVNDEEFQAFVKLYEKWRATLKALPGEWGKVEVAIQDVAETTEKAAESTEQMADSTDAIGKGWEGVQHVTVHVKNDFEAMAAALMAQVDLLRDQDRELERQRRAEQRAERDQDRAEKRRAAASQKLKADAKDIAKFTASSAVSLAKWTGAGLIGLAAGSLFGLGSLAGATSDARRAGLGLGVSTAEQRAYRVNFGRFIDPDANLSAVADAQNDWSKRWAFSAMGVNPNGKDPAQLAVQMLMRAKTMFDRSDMSQQFAQAHGLSQFYSMEDLRRLHNMSGAELGQQAGRFGADVRRFQLDDDTQRRWQDFSNTLDRAKLQIETVFVKRLEPLVPALEKFTGAVADVVDKAMGTPEFRRWIENLGDGVKSLAQTLGSKDFQDKVKRAATDLDLLFREVMAVAEKLKWLLPAPTNPGAPVPFDKKLDNAAKAGITGTAKWMFDPRNWDANPLNWNTPFRNTSKVHAALSPLEKSFGLPGDLLGKIFDKETGRGINMGLSKAGALGPFQLMPATATRFGVTDRTNFGQSAQAAAEYMAILLKEFHGDLRKAVAAYNWGEGNVEKDVKAHGSSWEQFLPKETRGYLDSVVGLAAPLDQAGSRPNIVPMGHKVDIHIHNNTGGSAVVTSSQLPQ